MGNADKIGKTQQIIYTIRKKSYLCKRFRETWNGLGVLQPIVAENISLTT